MSYIATQKWRINGKDITLCRTFPTGKEARKWAISNQLFIPGEYATRTRTEWKVEVAV